MEMVVRRRDILAEAAVKAREAVAIACKFDKNSRLPVHAVALKR